MSFSVDFVAKTVSDAQLGILNSSAPSEIRQFLLDAVGALEKQGRFTRAGTEGIRIKCSGHMNDGQQGSSEFEPSSDCSVAIRAVKSDTAA